MWLQELPPSPQNRTEDGQWGGGQGNTRRAPYTCMSHTSQCMNVTRARMDVTNGHCTDVSTQVSHGYHTWTSLADVSTNMSVIWLADMDVTLGHRHQICTVLPELTLAALEPPPTVPCWALPGSLPAAPEPCPRVGVGSLPPPPLTCSLLRSFTHPPACRAGSCRGPGAVLGAHLQAPTRE